MNLIDLIDRGATAAPGGPCLTARHLGVTLTHGEVHDLSHGVAAALGSAGFGPGSRVAVLSPNDPLAFVAVLGVMRAGATWVALNHRAPVGELRGLLEGLGCDLLVNHAELHAAAAAAVPADVPRWSLDDMHAWTTPGVRVDPLPHRPDAEVLVMGTGGTTGRPKGVPMTNRQLHVMTLGFAAHMPEASPVLLMAPPMTHAAGGMAFPVLAVGGSVIMHDGVDAESILRSIERDRVTRIFLPPTAVYGLLAHPLARQVDVSTLRHFLVAAAPMAAERLAEAVEVFGPVMTQVFGQAEAPMLCTFMGPQEIAAAAGDERLRHRLRSCGRPSLVAQIAIMSDDGTLLGPGEHGEIVVRSDLVMSGYVGDPRATAAVRRRGGWHGTGDIGYVDDDGYVYIVDRKRDVIITGGFNVFPGEVEEVLHRLEAVGECAVIGLPDAKWGEAVTAVIEPRPGHEIDSDDVLAFCRATLGPVKTPKSVIVRPLPRSVIGKVLKRALRDEYWVGRQRMV